MLHCRQEKNMQKRHARGKLDEIRARWENNPRYLMVRLAYKNALYHQQELQEGAAFIFT